MGGPRRAPNLKRTLAVQLLLLTLLLSSSPGASAARPGPQRTLQQLSDGAATDDGGAAGPAAEPGLLLVTDAAGPSPVCAALVDDLLGICAISADRIAMTYGRGSEVPPTAEEQAAAIAELKGAGLPPLRCCVAVASFITTDCFCSAAALASLGVQLDQTGAVEAAYVQGAATIMHRACSDTAPEPCARWVAG